MRTYRAKTNMKNVAASIFLLVLSIGGWAQSRNNWLTGTWRGTGHETADGKTWTMKLVAGKNGYKITYPSLKCGGDWRLIRFWSRSARFAEQIRYGESRCEPSGRVVIKRLTGDRIKFKYYYNGEKKIASYATLYRKRR